MMKVLCFSCVWILLHVWVDNLFCYVIRLSCNCDDDWIEIMDYYDAKVNWLERFSDFLLYVVGMYFKIQMHNTGYDTDTDG